MSLTKDEQTFWARVKALAQNNLGQASYDFFIEPAKLLEITDHNAKIYLDNNMHRDFWKKQEDLIKTAGFEIFGAEISFSLYSADDINLADYENADKVAETSELQETNKFVTSEIKNGLNHKYTFQNFVQGEGNRMTLGAAIAVANDPGGMYNPLFIYGGPGLGKTHLMNAIGNEILNDKPDARIKYVSSENFVNDYVQSSRKNQMQEFTDQYRTLDLLLLDDIQFFAKKEGTINEFFQTFNTLHDKGAQIVISSDRPPNELNEFEERLKSRFSWGLTTDITAPNYEDRMAILLNKVDEMNLQVPSETLSYIAGRIDSNVRDLEGALKNLKFYANTYHIDTIDIDTAAKALSNLESTKITQDKDISSQRIQEEVANFYKISVADMISKKRPKEIAYPRQIAMYLIREITGKSLPAIGKEFGGRDHTTVIYAHKQISDKMKTDTSLQKEMDTIKSQLK
ncbi:chromosomal replication initiator protein DnaA [Pseudolactococcus raffinolactis]|jgi:chromosomal replication initiator protein|uniref:Chromosomal replication initiator protein DnaA n=1 Tax=Pseudolactococcus raffinolactis TaxID=1366 RepID=A0A2A5SCV3_9LACT|nr:chromosomal replication initiator protein DnaA [Lactococcus raffinolactis]MBR2542675.1 chromosomal replication initiator protein DnaA [Lactococcus sp.]MDN5435086.1 chromosomal replication initiator protein DnaA [Acinetobacter sp.]MBW9298671.1 chromosomal replication initiator protein DnaA [Lactococcus raffinolactis]MBW9331631.1 chromosomal replication initiator protein DnaA [Lactococcus raffinolactis]MDG4961766.1 chromosomal replication initiator protein DnaA [Lactococcus raffinolactis]